TGAPLAADEAQTSPVEAGPVTAADKLRAMRDALPNSAASLAASVSPSPPASAITTLPAAMSVPMTPSPPPVASKGTGAWRDPLVAFASEALRGADVAVPVVSIDNELGELAHRLNLSVTARRGLTILYATYLVGEPALSLARLAKLLGEWPEALGQGQLAALTQKADGKLRLSATITNELDGIRR
ncbi:MAG TPA: hypothetical protein VGC41_00370, partial [Kofleriaceae bacterium]